MDWNIDFKTKLYIQVTYFLAEKIEIKAQYDESIPCCDQDHL